MYCYSTQVVHDNTVKFNEKLQLSIDRGICFTETTWDSYIKAITDQCGRSLVCAQGLSCDKLQKLKHAELLCTNVLSDSKMARGTVVNLFTRYGVQSVISQAEGANCSSSHKP